MKGLTDVLTDLKDGREERLQANGAFQSVEIQNTMLPLHMIIPVRSSSRSGFKLPRCCSGGGGLPTGFLSPLEFFHYGLAHANRRDALLQ